MGGRIDMNVQLTSSPEETVAELRTRLRGAVVAPGDPDYDETRRVMPGNVDLRPAAIARVADAADIAAVIAVARRTGLELAVRSGGHSTAGHSSTDGGLVIDLRAMTAIEIDLDHHSVWGETGRTADRLTQGVRGDWVASRFGGTGPGGHGGGDLGCRG